jgi:hypothetical protein
LNSNEGSAAKWLTFIAATFYPRHTDHAAKVLIATGRHLFEIIKRKSLLIAKYI